MIRGDGTTSKCKICGEKHGIMTPFGSIIIIPNCNCGKVRKTQRMQGCPNCKGVIIDLEYIAVDEYIAICRDCSREWAVW